MDTRGIFRYKSGRYRVRVTRNNVTYMVGWYLDIDEAIRARDNFLLAWAKDQNKDLPIYSSAWFKREREKQAESFRERYQQQQTKGIDRSKPVIVIANDVVGPRHRLYKLIRD